MNMGYPAVTSTCTFTPRNWKGDNRRVTAAEEPGKVESKWNDRECYLNRMAIRQQHRPKQRGHPQQVYDAATAHISNLNFLEFYTQYNAQFNANSRKTGEDQSNRFTIIPSKDPGRTVPIPKPDLPDNMRDPGHREHELYCEYRLFTLMPIRDPAHWEEVTMSANAAWEVSPLKSHFGPFHLAYFAFIEEFEARSCASGGVGTATRTARLLKRDGDAITSEVVSNLDAFDFDPVKLEGEQREAWMAMFKHMIGPGGGLLESTVVPQATLDALHHYYLDLDAELVTDNWVTRMASRDGIVTKAARPRVDTSRLNSEQKVALALLLDHYHASEAAAEFGSQPPPPLCLTIYGLGGTGKSHVLRAFQQTIDDEAALAASFAGPGSSLADAAPPSETKLCVMAPTGSAAAAIGGETLHACLKFPRKVKGQRRYQDADVELPAGSKNLNFIQNRHSGVEYYFCDEMGMMGCETVGLLDQRLKLAHASPLPFGGKSVIFFGHHAQLPPVKDEPAYSPKGAELKKVSAKPKSSGLTHLQVQGRHAQQLFTSAVILRQQERQRSSATGPRARAEYELFQGILGRVMDAAVTPTDWAELDRRSARARANPAEFAADGKGGQYLVPRVCASRASCSEANIASLLQHCETTGVPLIRIDAAHRGGAGAALVSSDAAAGLEPSLFLAKGAPVKCTWNGWQRAGIVNGARGFVHDVIYNLGEGPPSLPIAVLVRFPAESGYLGNSYLGDAVPGVVKFTTQTETFTDASKKPCSRTQLPLKLAFSDTIHSFQGRTENRVDIDLGKAEFSLGLAYVACSRVRALDHLVFDPMPVLERFNKHRSRLQSRFEEEKRLEDCFYRTILSLNAACALRVSQLHDEPRASAIASIAAGRDATAVVPCRWKRLANAGGSALHVGGSVRTVHDALVSFWYRWRANKKINLARETRNLVAPDYKREETYGRLIAQYTDSVKAASTEHQAAFFAAQDKERAYSTALGTAKVSTSTRANALLRTSPNAGAAAAAAAAAAELVAEKFRQAEKAKQQALAAQATVRSDMFHRYMTKVRHAYGLPLFPGYQPLDLPILDAAPRLDIALVKETLRMRMRLTDYLGGAARSQLWHNLASWATRIGFEVTRDHSAVQIGDSCAIVAAKVSVDLYHAQSDFTTVDTTYAVSEECLRLSNVALVGANTTGIDHTWTVYPCTADQTKFLSDDEADPVANYWNNGQIVRRFQTGAQGWLKWASFDNFLALVAKKVSMAAVGTFQGKEFYSVNTQDSRFGGMHWVSVVIEIVPKSHPHAPAPTAYAQADRASQSEPGAASTYLASRTSPPPSSVPTFFSLPRFDLAQASALPFSHSAGIGQLTLDPSSIAAAEAPYAALAATAHLPLTATKKAIAAVFGFCQSQGNR